MNMNRLIAILLLVALSLGAAADQALAQQAVSQSNNQNRSARSGDEFQLSTLLAQARPKRRPFFSLLAESRNPNLSASAFRITPAAVSPPVTGTGTVGMLTKWGGFTSNSSAVVDSNIFEDKFGKVGIGTSPTSSLLTVGGLIQSLSGGFQFPDGSVQTTSASGSLFGVAHDQTLRGDGTLTMPLGVAVPLSLGGQLRGAIITASNTTGTAVHGIGDTGVNGESTLGTGVFGKSNRGVGVAAESTHGLAISAISHNSTGVIAVTLSSNLNRAGIEAIGAPSAEGGIAATFTGDVRIQPWVGQRGDLTVAGKLQVTSGMKMFHIDHPVDPENKYLNHAAIESSEVLNIYSGNVTTDASGDAIVTLPDWFEALNKDFRYQLTVVGTFAQAIVAGKIRDNRFAIKTNTPNVEVSWQVTGLRSDPTAKKFAFKVEEEKAEHDRGYYLNPDAFDQPAEKGIQWARDPEGIQQLKKRWIEAEQMRHRRQSDQR